MNTLADWLYQRNVFSINGCIISIDVIRQLDVINQYIYTIRQLAVVFIQSRFSSISIKMLFCRVWKDVIAVTDSANYTDYRAENTNLYPPIGIWIISLLKTRCLAIFTQSDFSFLCSSVQSLFFISFSYCDVVAQNEIRLFSAVTCVSTAVMKMKMRIRIK